MSQFDELDLPSYTDYILPCQNEFAGLSTSYEDHCFCCLAQNEVMINLPNCQHKAFLQEYVVMHLPKILVCRICHYMLKKIEVFKRQVEESSKILLQQQWISQISNKLFDLQVMKTEYITIPNSVYETNDLEEKLVLNAIDATVSNAFDATATNAIDANISNTIDATKQNNTVVSAFKVDIKYEPIANDDVAIDIKKEPTTTDDRTDTKTDVELKQNSSNFEYDTHLPQLEKEEIKRNAQITKLDRFRMETKYEGKIRMVFLSNEEIMVEREKERKKERYLKLPYKCESCIKSFDREMALKTHIEKYHKRKGSFHCDFCKMVFVSAISYRGHIIRHLRSFECIACGKRGPFLSAIGQHYNLEHGQNSDEIDMLLKCDQCDFTSNSIRGHRRHLDKHKMHECSECGKMITSNNKLLIHIANKHKRQRFTCDVCGKDYSNKSMLAYHLAAVHKAEVGPRAASQRAYCAQCDMYFVTKYGLKHHLTRTHDSGENRKFVCGDCGAKFFIKSELQAHVDWKHLKIEKHKCSVCSKVFENSGRLKRHINHVHEKKEYARNKICHYCGKGFKASMYLESHIRTHTGERPFRCDVCAATFINKLSLRNHTKLKHLKPKNNNH